MLLWSDDLDATVAAVTEAGGTVTREPYAFPGGRRFSFTDPAGNELGAWQAADTGENAPLTEPSEA